MADDAAAGDLREDMGAEASTTSKGGGLKGALPGLLKYILIGVAAVIFIVTIVVVTNLIMNKGGKSQTAIPVGQEYTTAREAYDWYKLDQIRTYSKDDIPASVTVEVQLGYKKDDKAASTEITQRKVELIDFLRRFFSDKTIEELKPEKEDILRQDIRDQINDDILTNTSIRDVRFTAKDVVKQ